MAQPDLSAPIAKTTFRDEAAKRIRAEIVSGMLAPGRTHQIAEVANRLGVSITPVREALLGLSQDGLVEILRNKGFRVAEPTDQDLDEIVELRIMLEVPPLQRLAGKIDAAELRQLRALAKQMERAGKSGDLNTYLQTDRELHLRLLELAGNRQLVQIVARLRDQTRLLGIAGMAGTPSFDRTNDEHSELLDALESGDGKEVARIVTRHLRHARGLWANRPEPM